MGIYRWSIVLLIIFNQEIACCKPASRTPVLHSVYVRCRPRTPIRMGIIMKIIIPDNISITSYDPRKVITDMRDIVVLDEIVATKNIDADSWSSSIQVPAVRYGISFYVVIV